MSSPPNCSTTPYGYYGSTWNCTDYDSCKEQANPDIAGLGVILAFVVTATITLLIAWISYIFHPGEIDLQPDLSILDHHFLEWIWSLATIRPVLSSVWAKVVQKTIIIFSDSHLVTGLAILGTGFIRSHSLTIYHFHIIVFLAWQASSTHMTTLSILRTHLRRHRAVLKWRVVAMTFLFVMLFVALVLTVPAIRFGDTYWYLPLYRDSPAVCSWDWEYMKTWQPDCVFSLCMLTAGYLARLSKLFISTSTFFRKWLRDRPTIWLKLLFDRSERRAVASPFATSRMFWRLTGALVLSIYVNLRSLADLYESLLLELLWLNSILIWGTAKIFTQRSTAPVQPYEDTWGFGQILPLLLLTLPLIALPELYSDSMSEGRTNNMNSVCSEGSHRNPTKLPWYGNSEREYVEDREERLTVKSESPDRTSANAKEHERTSGRGGLRDTSSATEEAHLSECARDIPSRTSLIPLPPQRKSQSWCEASVSIHVLENGLQAESTNFTALPPIRKQPVSNTRSVLFTDHDLLYKSVSFKFLLFFEVLAAAAPFALLLSFMFLGVDNPGNSIFNPYYAISIIAPILVGPSAVWFFFMLPFSRITRGKLRYKANAKTALGFHGQRERTLY